MNLRRKPKPLTVDDLKRVRLEDGDTLILRYQQILSSDQMKHIYKGAQAVFPKNRIIVMDGDPAVAVLGKGPR